MSNDKIGISLVDVEDKYQQQVGAATTVRNTAVDAATRPMQDVKKALYALLGNYTRESDMAIELVEMIGRDKINALNEAARKARGVYVDAVESYDEERRKAYAADPFANWLNTRARDEYGSSYVDPILHRLPATIDEIKQVAIDNEWCTDFEHALKQATDDGALNVGTVEYAGTVSSYDVPEEHKPVDGETWEMILQLPAYVRTTDTRGRSRGVRSLTSYADAVTYRKVEPVDEG